VIYLALAVIYQAVAVIVVFIVLATIIAIANYNRTAITIINYDRKTLIVQATAENLTLLWHSAKPKI